MTVTANVLAQEIEPDSIAESRSLGEVVVTAPTVIKKVDKDIFIPSGDARRLSADGLQLLQNLNVPTVHVNEVMGTVSSLGNSVQIRINGREATVSELRQIEPANIRRVEWLANPGMKYNGASAVLNVITRNPGLGGSLLIQAMPSLTKSWMQGFASLKLNNGRSQWGVTVDEKLTNHVDAWREYHEEFTRPDGSSVSRTESPRGGSLTDSHTDFNLSYSYIKPDTTVVFVSLNGDKRWGFEENYKGIMTMSDNSAPLSIHDKTRSDGFTPGINAYVEQHMAHGNVISVDASASHYDGHARHLYSEQSNDGQPMHAAVTEVNTDIHDRNTAFGLTSNYEKSWEKSVLTAGVTYGGNRNRSTYENLDDKVFHQSQDRLHFFGEYSRTIGKVNLTAGVGAQYSRFRFRETDRGNSSWNFRPKASVTFNPCNASRWYLSFYTWQSTPSLSETNEVAQQIDGFQWRIGNPGLKTTTTYRIDAQYRYGGNRLFATLGINAQTTPDAIASYYYWDGSRLISSYENSRRRQWLSAYFSPDIVVIPGWFNLQGFLRWGVTRTEGTGYNLTRHNWSGSINASLYHWGFQLLLKYERLSSNLYGEFESWGQKMSMAALAYQWKNWQFMAAVFCPFNKYEQGSRLLNRYNRNEKSIRSDIVMPLLQVTYNLRWGRQKQEVNKRVNAESSIDASKASSR